MNAQITDHGTYIEKVEDPRFPEAAKYGLLNALDAPLVRLLDHYILDEGVSVLVLEKARPLDLDASRSDDFRRVIEWTIEFNRVKSLLTHNSFSS